MACPPGSILSNRQCAFQVPTPFIKGETNKVNSESSQSAPCCLGSRAPVDLSRYLCSASELMLFCHLQQFHGGAGLRCLEFLFWNRLMKAGASAHGSWMDDADASTGARDACVCLLYKMPPALLKMQMASPHP